MNNAYQILNDIFREIGILKSISTLAQWDNDVTMPKAAYKIKQDQMIFLADQTHQRLNSSKIIDLIQQAETETLSDWQAANLRRMKQQYLNNKSVDESLLLAITKAKLECELNWREARNNNDFKLFAKYFAPVLKLMQEISKCKADMFGLTPYDALLDAYDPGRKSAEIDIIFSNVEQFLPDMILQVKEKQRSQKIIPLNSNFPVEQQRNIGITCMKMLGFDLNKGRLDTSTHPFSCALSPDDVRITTRYEEKNFLPGLFAILHETGHGLYNQYLPQEFIFQLVGQDCGMTIHESQSLFVERHIGVTKAFFNWLAPHIAKAFGKDSALQPENLYKLATQVGSSMIRVNADEVTYPAHILLRYKLEKAMLAGDLQIAELPQAWNAESYRLLNEKPQNDQDGCLQDIHWAWGAFGYFPTYTLGAMFAAQINHHLNQAMKVDKLIQHGDLKPVISWMNNNIHAYGSKYNADDLIIKSTGSALDANIFKQYLITKYLEE